ncbi:MAG: Flp family type IVb pilin [Microthrixaceae bacterium]
MLTSYEFIAAYLQAKVKSERGASLVEYALLVALIAVACIAAMSFLKGGIDSKFSEAGNSLS